MLVLLCAANRTMVLYWFEAKQYTADAFWALLLPALVVWAIEADDDRQRMRRAAGWWLIRNHRTVARKRGGDRDSSLRPGSDRGASWRLHRRAAWTIATLGLIWVAGALLQNQFAMRYTLNSVYLYDYWATSFPPRLVGPAGAVLWIFKRLPLLALNPMDTERWFVLWILALCGFVFASNRALGAVFAIVPLTAFALAVFWIVPLYGRFVLWIVPALAVGVGLAVDRAARLTFEGVRRRNVARLAVGVIVVAGVIRLCDDMMARGGRDSFQFERPDSKQNLDDRAAVHWLMARRLEGDAILATKLAWPAIWRDGEIPIGTDAAAHGRMP